MLGDITLYDDAAFGQPGEVEFVVVSGTAAQKIKAGEPVLKALAGVAVSALATNKPVVATDYLAGIAASVSTDTVAAAGTVKVTKMVPGMSWLIAPNVAATWNTQAKYDALVGARVLLDLTGTAVAGTATYTILAADGATNGCVILPLDIKKYPGKVRFAFREGCNYLS
jgi:hypothetical protein